jgi:hypothetical protein
MASPKIEAAVKALADAGQDEFDQQAFERAEDLASDAMTIGGKFGASPNEIARAEGIRNRARLQLYGQPT